MNSEAGKPSGSGLPDQSTTRATNPYRACRQFERMVFRGVPEDLRQPVVHRPSEEKGIQIATVVYDFKNRTVTYKYPDGKIIISGPNGSDTIDLQQP